MNTFLQELMLSGRLLRSGDIPGGGLYSAERGKSPATLALDRDAELVQLIELCNLEVLQAERPGLEASLTKFHQSAWPLIEAKPHVSSWYSELIDEHLEAVALGQIKRLVINQPPRTGKSLKISVTWPCWCWTRQPGLRWFFASYSKELSYMHGQLRRAVLESDWYRDLWGSRFKITRRLLSDYRNSAHGVLVSTSVGGTGTGKGGDILVADDLLSVEQGFSQADRERANRYFDQTFLTRADDWQSGRIVVVMQRLHEDDLTGHVLKSAHDREWLILRLPMEAEGHETITFPGSGRVHSRRPGESLCEERFPASFFEGRKLELGSYAYAGQMQQRPAPLGGGILKRSWWRFYGTAECPKPSKFDSIMQSWDLAFKGKTTSDYVTGQVWGKLGANMFLLAQVRGRMSFPACRQAIRDMNRRFPLTAEIAIEDTANGPAIIDDLRNEIPGIVPVRPENDKIARVHAITAYLEAGNVYLPHESMSDVAWFAYLYEELAGEANGGRLEQARAGLQDYLNEHDLFPHAAHDDQVDATTQAIMRMTHRGPSMLEYLRVLVQEQESREAPVAPSITYG